MTLKRISVRVEIPSGLGDHAAVELAGRLAATSDAEIDVLAYVTEVLPTLAQAEKREASFEDTRQEFERIAARDGLRLRMFDRSSYAHGAGDVFADHLRVSDLGIIHYPVQPSAVARMVASAALFNGGAPLLLVPGPAGTAALPSSILVGWDGSAAAARALRAAIALAGPRCRITIASIEETGAHRPGQSGVEAAHLAAMHGAESTFVVLEGKGDPVRDVLERHCVESGADLLVAGAVRHGTLHEMLFGSLTTSILAQGPGHPTLLVA